MQGVPRFFVLAKAHQADCGNALPTTYMGHAKDVYEEGALIFPAVKVQEDYKNIEDIIRICRMRIRVPEQWWGDYLAALGAVRIGERELLELGREVGWDALAQYAEDWFDYSEQRMIEAIRRLPSGEVVARSAHDPFPGVPDGIPTKVTVTVDAEAARITVDLRDNPDCQPCGLNLTEGCAKTAAAVGIYNGIIDHSVPPNAGSFRRVDILVRENCCCGIPRHPYSCSVATTNLADRVSNPVQVALAELADGFGMAETGPIIPAGMGVISGTDPRHHDAAFVNQIFLACTGGAGTPVSDGFLSIIHVGNAGMCRHDSIEVDELHHPLFVSHRYLVPDTEGAGRFRGAPSGYTEFGPVDGCTMQVLYTSDGTINPAQGARGGGPGARAKALKRAPRRQPRRAPQLLWRDARAGRAHRLLLGGRRRLRPAARARGFARQARPRRRLDHPGARRGGLRPRARRRGRDRPAGDRRETRRAGRCARLLNRCRRLSRQALACRRAGRRQRT